MQVKSKEFASFAFALILATSTLMAILPAANAQKTNITLAATLYPLIGQNSETLITWMPTPNPFNPGGLYEVPNEVNSARWANATITFTRPDGSQDIKTGPFTVYKLVYASGSVGFNPRFEYIYTPNVQGNWTVTFAWPGDNAYNPINVTNTFTVGPHFEKRTSWALLSIRPYPAVGLNQEVLVNAFVTPPPMSSYENFKDIKFVIRRGDGSVYLDFSMDSEAPGVLWFSIYPEKVGNWSIGMSWAGSYFYKPCSITRYFTVQDAQIPYYQDTPLPTDYWKFPVNVYNREWRNIAGPWLQPGYNGSIGSCNQYTEAPRSAHIVWKIPPFNSAGGFIGSTDQSSGITTANIYTSTAASIACIMAGRGYYAAGGNIYCVDIRTGETLWTAPGSAMSKFGLPSGLVGATRSRAPVLYYFGTNSFIIYDAITGAVTLNTTGLPMLLYNDPYVYSVVGSNWIKWTTAGTSTNFASRIVYNITDPYLAFPYSPATWPWNYVLYDDLIVFQLQRYGRVTYEDAVMEGQVARNATTGALVYVKQTIDPANADTWWLQQGPSRAAGYGLYYYQVTGVPAQMSTTDPNALTTGGYIAFKTKDGTLAWTSEPYKTYPWGCFHSYNPLANGYGLIFDLSYAGVYALNATNGKVAWEYHPGNSGMETPYNTWPFGSVGSVVGGGVLFAPETEHSPTLYYRGNTLKAIDVTNGKELWDIMGYYTPTAIAYGTLMAIDTPNGYTYAFAKGQSATTVTTQNDVYAKGSSVLIKGTVTDQSPAQKGTPAVSDDSMTAWMEYLHMQQPKPTNATGVPVKLTAVDQGGKSVDLGTVWSDANGNFKKLWTPATEGEYAIVASFGGSLSYYGSQAETVVGVAPAAAAPSGSVIPTESPSASVTPPATSAPPTTEPTPSSTVPPTTPTASATPPPTATPPTGGEIDMVLITAAAVVIIAAIIVAAVLLRRRK